MRPTSKASDTAEPGAFHISVPREGTQMTRRRQIGTGGSTVTRVTPDELYMRATALGWHGESSAHCYCEFKARKHDEAASETGAVFDCAL